MRRSYWLFLFTFALVFYALGAAYVEGFVNYRTWHLIGAEEFTAYHRALSPRIIAFLVIPAFSIAIFTAILIWLRPPAVPRWGLILSLVLTVSIIVISITVQIPIQTQFYDSGMSPALLDKLIMTDWFRKVPATANAVLFGWMMAKILRQADAANV